VPPSARIRYAQDNVTYDSECGSPDDEGRLALRTDRDPYSRHRDEEGELKSEHGREPFPGIGMNELLISARTAYGGVVRSWEKQHDSSRFSRTLVLWP